MLLKPTLILLVLILFIVGCNKSNKNNLSINPPINYSTKFLKLSKNKDCTLIKRLFYINKAYFTYSNGIKDSVTLDILSYKSFLHKKNIELDSVLIYSKKMLFLAQKTRDSFQIGRSYFKIAEYFRNKNINDSAYFYYNKSKNVLIGLKDSIQVARKLNIMGRILIDDGDYFAGETTLIEALEYLKSKKDRTSTVQIYFNLSIALRNQFNYDNALKYINKAIEFNKSEKNKIILYNSKALILRNNKKYDEVIKLYQNLLKTEFVLKNKKEYARIIDNMGYTKWLSNNSLNVESELLEALKIRKCLNDVQGLIASNSHLMKYYAKKNKTKAIQYANTLYRLTVKQNNIEDRLEALIYLGKLTSINNYKKYTQSYIRINDSITKARTLARNKNAVIRYETAKYKEEALLSESESKAKGIKLIKEKSRRNLLLLATSILLGVIFFIMYHWRQRIKIARIKERHQTNTHLSKKLHDEVGNDLYYLLLQLQKVTGFLNNHENLKILQGFDKVYHKIRDFSRDTKVETGLEYGDELLSLLDSYGDSTTKVITSELEQGFWHNVAPIKKEELYWVLKELLTNMKKHSNASIVAITFTKNTKDIIVQYTDNGIGINLDHTNSKNGILNVENRMKDIGGTITFDSKPKEGFKATIVFAP